MDLRGDSLKKTEIADALNPQNAHKMMLDDHLTPPSSPVYSYSADVFAASSCLSPTRSELREFPMFADDSDFQRSKNSMKAKLEVLSACTVSFSKLLLLMTSENCLEKENHLVTKFVGIIDLCKRLSAMIHDAIDNGAHDFRGARRMEISREYGRYDMPQLAEWAEDKLKILGRLLNESQKYIYNVDEETADELLHNSNSPHKPVGEQESNFEPTDFFADMASPMPIWHPTEDRAAFLLCLEAPQDISSLFGDA